jgi:hypothetical protein
VSAVPKTKVFEHVQIRAIEAGFSTSVRTDGISVRNKNQGGNPEETGRPTQATKGSEHTIQSVTDSGRSSVDDNKIPSVINK